MNRTLKSLQYLLFDFCASYGVWLLFFLMRRYVFERPTFSYNDDKFFQQLVAAAIIAAYWVLLYLISGIYADPYRKSRLREAVTLFRTTALGVLVIFFFIFLDDRNP